MVFFHQLLIIIGRFRALIANKVPRSRVFLANSKDLCLVSICVAYLTFAPLLFTHSVVPIWRSDSRLPVKRASLSSGTDQGIGFPHWQHFLQCLLIILPPQFHPPTVPCSPHPLPFISIPFLPLRFLSFPSLSLRMVSLLSCHISNPAGTSGLAGNKLIWRIFNSDPQFFLMKENSTSYSISIFPVRNRCPFNVWWPPSSHLCCSASRPLTLVTPRFDS